MLYLLFLLPLLGGIGCFLYFFLRRMGKTFGVDTGRKRNKIILLLTAAVLTVMSAMIMNVSAIVILHVVGIGATLQLADLLLRLIAKKRYTEGFRPWKKIYGSGILPLLLTAVAVIAGYVNLHNVVRTDYTVTTNKEIRQEGYRIVLIADVHFGVSLDSEEVLEKCREINATDPDLVILCGDIVDNGTSTREMYDVFQALGTLKSEFGTFYVHGNHDRPMDLVASEFTEEQLISAIEQNGITVLQDTSLQLTDDLFLVGREDRSRERQGSTRVSVEELLSGADRNDFLLVLDHQPNQYAENGASGTDLLLSGHTHGGQLFPLNLLMQIIPFNDGVYGSYAIGTEGTAIVTSGFAGWNFPIKTAAPAEYVVIQVQPE